MRTEKFLKNSFFTAALQIVTVLAGLVIPRFMLRYYGSEINGLVSSLTQFISYFNLIEAGIAGSVVYYLYKPLHDRDEKIISSIVVTAKKYYTKCGLIFLGLVFILACIYPLFVKTEGLSRIEIFILTLVIGTRGICDFFIMSKYRVLLTADQKVYVLSLASIVSTLLNTVCIAFFSHIGLSVVLVRCIALISVFSTTIILFVYTKKNYAFLNFNAEQNKTCLEKRGDALFLQLLGVVQNGAPVIILTVFAGLTDVSIYSIYIMIIGGLRSFLAIFESGLSASFGDVIAEKNIKTLQNTTEIFQTAYYILITTVYATAAIMIQPFIKLYTSGITDADYSNVLIGILFVFDGFFYNLKTPQGMLIISAGMYRETRWRSLTQALIILIGGIILVPLLGLKGVVIASITANLYRTIDLLFFVPKYITHLPVWNTLKRQSLCIIFLSIIVYISTTIKLSFISNYLYWCCISLVFFICFLLIILFFFLLMDKTVLYELYARLKVLIRKEKK